MLDGQGFEGLVGRSFGGFRVTRLIARGGMGVVFEGMQESLDRPVAIKFLYPHLSDDDRFRDRFEREARAAARLNHPNIVRILDFGVDGGLYYMIQDLIVGESLRERLTELHSSGGTLRTDAVIMIVEPVGRALAYAHEHGYVHRDVKPGNVLLDGNGQAYLTDFGVVKIAGANSLTAAGMIIGTPEYMAPEQSAGVIDVGPAADQYSLAIVTYEMLVGRVPFQAPTPAAVMRMHLTDPPPPPRTVVPWFPEEVEKVLVRALAKEPFDRYPSVADFVANLKDSVAKAQQAAGGTISHPPVGPIGPVVAAPLAAESTSQEVAPVTAPPTGASPPDGAPPIDGAAVAMAAGGSSGRTSSSKGPVLLVAGAGVVGLLAIVLALAAFFVIRGRGSSGDTRTPVISSSATSTTAIVSAASPTTAATTAPTATSAKTQVAAAVTPTAAPTPVASPTSASVVPTAPPGSVLAILFSSHRGGVHDSEIYVMNMDGSGERKVTDNRGHTWGPRFSPDGTKLVYSSTVPGEHTVHDAEGGGLTGSGNHDVYVADFSGDSIANLQTVNSNNITAGYTSWDNGWSWSPDGQWIAFTSDRAGNWEIYKMTTDGKTIVRLTENPAQDGWPWWTPDGQHILFSSNRSGQSEIFMMNADGSNVVQLTNIPDRSNLYPAVSSDGKKVVFSSQLTSVNEGDIYIMNIDGTGLTRLTNTVALNNIPSFCPDNEHIVYESDQDGNANIYLMNVDGTNQTRLTNDPGEDTTASCGYFKQSSP